MAFHCPVGTKEATEPRGKECDHPASGRRQVWVTWPREVEDTHGFLFLWNPLLIEQVEKNTQPRSRKQQRKPDDDGSESASQPSAGEEDGGAGVLPGRDSTRQTSPSTARNADLRWEIGFLDNSDQLC